MLTRTQRAISRAGKLDRAHRQCEEADYALTKAYQEAKDADPELATIIASAIMLLGRRKVQ